jgi:Ca2+/Na+ antiporter
MLNLKNIKKDIASGDFFLRVSAFFSGKIKLIVFALFFLLSLCCVYIWYSYVYNYQWSAEKKAEYMKTKDEEVTFNRKKFQEIVEKERKRAEEYERPIEIKKDIFGIK